MKVSPSVTRLRAPNPGPMTLTGTNTYVVRAGGAVLVVDPGPALAEHREAVMAEVGDGAVAAILLTHHHGDHSELAAELSTALDAPVLGAAELVPDGTPRDLGEVVPGVGDVVVVPTPGHTADSVSFLLPGERLLLSGDHVLGGATTVVLHPDGNLGDYLDSLATCEDMVRDGRVDQIAPGHGDQVEDPASWLAHYRRHRLERLGQVRDALAGGASSAEEVLALLYPGAEGRLAWAADKMVRAQMAYLEAQE